MKIFIFIKKSIEIAFLSVLFLNLNPTDVNSDSSTRFDEAISQQKQKGIVKTGDENIETLTPKDRIEFENLLKKVLGVSLFEEKKKVPDKVLRYKWRSMLDEHILRVYATSFGKPGNKGETMHFKDGSRVRWGIIAVALPDPSAIGKWVEVRRIDGDGNRSHWVKMKVKDLGPWFRDDPYWKNKSKKPRAITYFKKKKRRFDGRVVINPAGIDITPWGWQKLGIPADKSYYHSQHVEWRFAS